MKKGKGRLVYTKDGKVWLHISVTVHRDSAWPFDRENQPVEVEIGDAVIQGRKCLVVYPQKKKEGEKSGK